MIEANKDTVAIFEKIGIIECATKIPTPSLFTLDAKDQYTPWLRTTNNNRSLLKMFELYPILHPKDTLRAIHAELNRGLAKAMPIGIGYCANVLFKNTKDHPFSKGRKYRSENFLQQKDHNGVCGMHASLVIGRRHHPVSGVPQLLIRNSWGHSCYSYHQDWDCEASRGTVWVDENVLVKAIFETQVVQR